MLRKSFGPVCLVLLLLSVTACQPTIPKEALELTPDSLSRRQMQTRVFETDDETKILTAAAGLLQDLGFNLDESDTQLGILVASKERDATDGGQVAGAVLLAILVGYYPDVDDEQRIRASVVTRQLEGRDGYAVRLTMQRIVWGQSGKVTLTEPLDDPAIYQEFFSKLSKSVFLEAQSLE